MKRTSILHKSSAGFSLVELMVAIAVGAILLGALTQIYAGSKVTYKTEEAMGRLQENVRYGLDLLSRDLRMAGYSGCISYSKINNIASPANSEYQLGIGIFGYEYSDVPTSGTTILQTDVRTDTDVLQIQSLSPSSALLKDDLIPTNANIQLTSNTDGFQADEVLVATDCGSTDVFRATNVSSGGSGITIAHASSSNTANFLSKQYAKYDTEIMRLQTNIYYVGQNASGKYSLMRRRLGFYTSGDANQWCTNSGTAYGMCKEEVIEGVDDMQVLYGVDTDGNSTAEKYVTANTIGSGAGACQQRTTSTASGTLCWSDVVSAKINLLLRTVDGTVAPKVMGYPSSSIPLFDGNTAPTLSDRSFRRVYTLTVTLRNKTL